MPQFIKTIFFTFNQKSPTEKPVWLGQLRKSINTSNSYYLKQSENALIKSFKSQQTEKSLDHSMWIDP